MLSNSLFAALIALAHKRYVWDNDLLPLASFKMVGARSICFCAYYAFFSCCNADTWASEVGVLSEEQPYLITTRKQVPKGTNGAISLLGCGMSVLGGFYIGFGVILIDLMWFFLVPGI